MNPYVVISTIAGCIATCTGIVTVLALMGIPVLMGLLGIYAIAIVTMLVMQQHARQNCDMRDSRDGLSDRGHGRSYSRAGNSFYTGSKVATTEARRYRESVQ